MTLNNVLSEYENYLKGRGFRERTVKKRLSTLKQFDAVLLSVDKRDLRETGVAEFTAFDDSLAERELAVGSRVQYLSAVRQFYIWLYKNDLIITPVSDLVPEIKPKYKEKSLFTVEEMNKFLNGITVSLRDRTIFELLYSSGLRVRELLYLKWKDYLAKERKLKVVQGKGRVDRYVPVSVTAALYLKKWKEESSFDKNWDKKSFIFLGSYTGHLSDSYVGRIFHKYLDKTEITKKGLTVHSIRHSVATHLLEAGAGVRYVAELLGHKDMETTVRYTHPTNESQKRAYRMYHPRENVFFREIDEEYERELSLFREKFLAREEHINKYGTGR